MIKEEGNVAAIFIEPVVGTNGVIVPPPEYLPRLRQIADADLPSFHQGVYQPQAGAVAQDFE